MSTVNDDRYHESNEEDRNEVITGNQQMHIDDLRGKAVVNMANGTKVGTLEDIAIEPNSKRIMALIMSAGSAFQRDVIGIPADQVHVWGKDAILVRDVNALYRSGSWPADRDQWVNALERLKGTSVVSLEGQKLGQVDDILIEPDGILSGFTLGQSSIQNLFSSDANTQAPYISAQAIRTLGRDVVIVDTAAQPPKSQSVADENLGNSEDDPSHLGGARRYPGATRSTDQVL